MLLWGGQFVSQMGDRLAMVAFPWLIFRSTDSAFSTGVALALYTLPYVLFGTYAGVIIDRFNKRAVMVTADVARAILVLFVPFVASRWLPGVYVLGFVTSSVSVFFEPCMLAMLPDLVPGKKLTRANSLMATGETLTEVVGYAAAGFVVYYVSARASFTADSATFIVSAVALMAMRYRPAKRRTAGFSFRGMGGEAHEAISYLAGHRGLAANTALAVTVTLGLGASYPLTFLYAVRVVGGGMRSFGLLESSIALGYLAGALAMAWLGDRVPKGIAMTLGVGVLGAGLAVIGVVSHLSLALVPFFVAGIANAVAFISIQTYVQQATPKHLRGRIFGVRYTLTQGTYAVSVLLGGALATRMDVQTLFIACGTVVAVPALVGVYITAVRHA